MPDAINFLLFPQYRHRVIRHNPQPENETKKIFCFKDHVRMSFKEWHLIIFIEFQKLRFSLNYNNFLKFLDETFY